jgi:hypothetical protein
MVAMINYNYPFTKSIFAGVGYPLFIPPVVLYES